jgi:hypothetical protein
MSKLKAIKPKEAPQTKPKILIFGKAGVGKTYTALDFPSAYYIDTEGGATLPAYTDKLTGSGGAYYGIEQGSLSFDSIIEEVKALATEKHNFKTLIIDSITKVYNHEIAKEQERLGDKDAFGASKKPAISYMRQLISWLSRLDMNVILVAHETQEWEKGEAIGSTFDCFNKVEYELDLCLQIYRLGDEHKARVRKSRFESFPNGASFEWSYNEFADRYGKEIIEKDTQSIELASPEQIKELIHYCDLMNISEGEKNKWFEKAKCESFQDMDSDKAQKLIDMLKTKLDKKVGK